MRVVREGVGLRRLLIHPRIQDLVERVPLALLVAPLVVRLGADRVREARLGEEGGEGGGEEYTKLDGL